MTRNKCVLIKLLAQVSLSVSFLCTFQKNISSLGRTPYSQPLFSGPPRGCNVAITTVQANSTKTCEFWMALQFCPNSTTYPQMGPIIFAPRELYQQQQSPRRTPDMQVSMNQLNVLLHYSIFFSFIFS